jgi:hypothetical protein
VWRHWKEYWESPLESKTTATLKTSQMSNDIPSLEYLLWLSGKHGFQNHHMNDWLQAKTAVPSIMFLQPSKNMDTQTQPSMKTGNLHLFYSKNFGCSKTWTQQKKHQAAIQISTISQINKRSSSELEQAIGQLVTFAIFFAMQSYEYLKVHPPKQQHAEIVRLCNIHFFQGAKQLGHDHPKLEYADCVSVTFKRQ